MTSRDFNRITLIAVTGLMDAQGEAFALAWSQTQMPGARALLLSPQEPAILPARVEHRRIAPLNYHEYSWFIMFVLWTFIETDYVLIVQSDGWVIDGRNWSDDFFQYDYIGAPTHMARVVTSEGVRWERAYSWHQYLGRPDCVVTVVQNGGFSLRSRRMLRALIDHRHIKVELSPPDMLIGDPPEMHWIGTGPNEDVQLTAVLREPLQAAGLRFAPLAVCKRFAVEHAGLFEREDDLMSLFGQHGRFRRLVNADPPVVRYAVPPEAFHGGAEAAVARMLQRQGFRVEVP